MSRLKPDQLYAGARGRLSLGDVAKLGRGYVVQPKLDGSYGICSTDRRGRIANVILRSGKLMSPKMLSEFSAIRWQPNATLVCELEIWAEASNRCAATRGHRMIHVFDALRVGGRDMSALPYRERYSALMRAESELVCDSTDKPWTTDANERAHSLKSGQFTKPIPQSWRRMRVVPQMPCSRAEQAWADWVELGADPVEGLVVVAQGAPIGRRRAKRKVKAAEHIDATCVRVSEKTVLLVFGGNAFVVSKGKHAVNVGDVIEVASDGFYESEPTPKFPRIRRVRHDLTTTTNDRRTA